MTLTKLASAGIDTHSREYRIADVFWWAVLVASTIGFAIATAGYTADTAPKEYRTLVTVLTATPSVLLFIVVVGGVLAIRAAPLFHVCVIAIAAIAGAAAISFTTSLAALGDLSSKMEATSPALAQWLPLLLCGVTAVSVLWLVVLPSLILQTSTAGESAGVTNLDDIFAERTPVRPGIPEPQQQSQQQYHIPEQEWTPQDVLDAEFVQDDAL